MCTYPSVCFCAAQNRTSVNKDGLGSLRSFPGGSDGKESACNAGDPGLIPRSGRSRGEGNGNPLQYSCLENPMDRGSWQATVHRVTELHTTRLSHTFTLSLCLPPFSPNFIRSSHLTPSAFKSLHAADKKHFFPETKYSLGQSLKYNNWLKLSSLISE